MIDKIPLSKPYDRGERRVPGLRDFEMASQCRVYKANADGTPGRFLRMETPRFYLTDFRFGRALFK